MQDKEIFQSFAKQFGEVEFEGKSYALIQEASPTNRVFTGWFGDAQNGETYISEWTAPAMGEDGNEYVVRWQFEAVKGQEPADDEWPWDNVYEVIAA